MKRTLCLILALLFALSLAACGNTAASASPSAAPAASDAAWSDEYEQKTVTIEGAPTGDVELTIAQIRALQQHHLDGSFMRTTGLYEEYQMEGVYITDIMALANVDLTKYAGIGVVGTDGYYCMVSREIIEKTPDLMLALEVNGKKQLEKDLAPAWLAVQGQFGPYWVKRVCRIILYETIPAKEITSMWVFMNLADGIEPYEYEYYGSKDKSIDMEQIWARLDNVDKDAFFTMKSSDGFLKNEVINMVLKRYYIKYEGVDAPTNISPYIVLGQNVQNIAWCSSNADAMIFPEELLAYMTTTQIDGITGIPLSEVMYEVGVDKLKGLEFDVIGMDGENELVTGEQLAQGILTVGENGKYGVIWSGEVGKNNIENLLRIRLHGSGGAVAPSASAGTATEPVTDPEQSETPASMAKVSGIPASDPGDTEIVLTVSGNGVSNTLELTLSQLKKITSGYAEVVYSTVNNWPTKHFVAAKGVKIETLLKLAGLKSSAKSFTLSSADGYYCELTRDQLLGTRYSYPNIESDSASGKRSVPALVAWEYAESESLADASAGEIRNYIGQNCLTEVNTSASVQDLTMIDASTTDLGNWNEPDISFEENGDGTYTVTLTNLDGGEAKMYYTTDGSRPSTDSTLYNPSADHFQPQLNAPFTVDAGTTVRAFISGVGRGDSSVAKVKIG